MVPSSAADTTEGRSASLLRSRITTGAPSLTKATRLLVVPRSMPTTLDMLTPGGPAPWSRRHLPLDARQQIVDVVAFKDALAQSFEDRAALDDRGIPVDENIPAQGQLLELRHVRRPLRFDRRARALQTRLPRVIGLARRTQIANLVEFLVEGEHFFEQIGRNLPGRFFGSPGGEAFKLQQVFDTRGRLLQCPVGVVEVRRSLEARAALGHRRVEKEVRMQLTAQAAEPLLEIVRVDGQLARQAEKREVIAVAADGEKPGALRAEVGVDGRAAAAIAADLKRVCDLGTHGEQVPTGTLPMPRTSFRSRRPTCRSGC